MPDDKKDNLKIPPRPIFIKHPNNKLAIFTVNKKIYGFRYDNEQIHTTNIKYETKDPEKAITDYIFKITKNNEKYNNEAIYNDISTQRTEYIIKELKSAIANNQSHGHLDKANDLEKAKIIDILKEHNLSNPFEKNTKLEKSGTQKALEQIGNNKNTIISYLFLLNQLVTGFKPTLEGNKSE